MHEALDEVHVLVEATLYDALQILLYLRASHLDHHAEGRVCALGELGDVPAHYRYLAVFDLVHRFGLNELELVLLTWAAQLDPHVAAANSFSLVDDPNIHGDVLKH